MNSAFNIFANLMILVATSEIYADATEDKGRFRSMTTEERKEVQETTVDDLANKFSTKSKDFFIRLTALQKANNKVKDLVNDSKPNDNQMTSLKMSLLSDDPYGRKNKFEDMQYGVLGQSNKVAGDQVKSSSAYYQKLKSGLQMEWSFGSESSKPKDNVAPIRYGLVVEDITPEKSWDRASIGPSDQELQYAKPARVKYSIAPLDSQGPSVTQVEENITLHEDSNVIEDMWSRRAKIDPTFTSILEPNESVDVNASSAGGLPKMRFKVLQKQNLYSLEVNFDQQMKKESLFHEVKIPVGEKMHFARKYNEERSPIQTGIYNVLYYSKYPSVNLFYLDQEEKFRGEMFFLKTSTEEIKTTADMAPQWKPGQSVLKDEREKYSISWNLLI